MKKTVFLIIVLSMGISLMGAQGGPLLLNERATARDFLMPPQARKPKPEFKSNFLKDLGVGFVFGSKTSFYRYKNNVFYKKAVETGNPYTDVYAHVNNWLHFEAATPIINVMYESTVPIWSTFESSPRFSITHFDALGAFYWCKDTPMLAPLFLSAPYVTHSVMSTRDFTQDTWDFKVLLLLDYRVTTETFLLENTNPYRIKTKRLYYLAMTSYIELMQGFSRSLHLMETAEGEDYEGIGLEMFPVLPFFDIYKATTTTEELIHGTWYEQSKVSELNFEVGVFYVHEYHFPKYKNLILQPYFKWILYSSRYVKNSVDGVFRPESSIEASISLQYVF